MVFNGRRSDEMLREYGRWLPYITELFLPACDSEHGDLLHLPFPGSIADQPYMTMQIILLVQDGYRKMLSERVEKMRASAGPKRRPRSR